MHEGNALMGPSSLCGFVLNISGSPLFREGIQSSKQCECPVLYWAIGNYIKP